MTREDLIDKVTQKVLENKGFNYATDPTEYGQNCYDITLETRDEIDFILKTIDEIRSKIFHHQV